jgi:tRNA threonylcarbamoyladenosine biosynthesis protein TsaE
MLSNGWNSESLIAEATTDSAESTQALAESWACYFKAGDVITLVGDLGAGKTTFVKGLAQGLGVAESIAVTSPTFTYFQHYGDGAVLFYHFDLYRLSGEEDFLSLGFDDFLDDREAIACIEWPERIAALLPVPHYHLCLTSLTPQTRKLTLWRRY